MAESGIESVAAAVACRGRCPLTRGEGTPGGREPRRNVRRGWRQRTVVQRARLIERGVCRIRVIELNLIGGVEQPVDLEQVAHRADVVRLAIGLDEVGGRLVSPDGRTAAMPQ